MSSSRQDYCEIVSHFPLPPSIHHDTRELFGDYGSPWAIDVRVCKDTGAVDFIPQRCFKCPSSKTWNGLPSMLAARRPSMPLLPPISANVLEEPCISDLHIANRSLSETIRITKNLLTGHLRFRAPHQKRILKQAAQKILDILERQTREERFVEDEELYGTERQLPLKDSQGGEDEFSMEDDEWQEEQQMGFDKGFGKESTLKLFDVNFLLHYNKLLRKLADCSKNVLGKSCNPKRVNSLYTGGALSYITPISQIAGTQHEGAIVIPTGSHLNDIAVYPVRFDFDGFIQLSESCEVMTLNDRSSRVFQTESQDLNGQQYVACRQEHTCTMLEILSSVEAGKIDKGLKVHKSFTLPLGEGRITDVQLSPYIGGETLISTSTGAVYIWTLSRPPRLVHGNAKSSGKPSFNAPPWSPIAPDNWSSCHFGAHPRLGLFCDRATCCIIDFRGPHELSRDLLTLPHPSLHSSESVMVTRKHSAASSFYHFIATDFSILLMDERFLKYPVLLWSHALSTAPQYIDIVSNTMHGDCNDQLLIISSQESAETVCYQFHDENISTSIPPQACGAPWRISKPSDFAMMCVNAGYVSDSRVIKARLAAPLAGVCAVPRNLPNRHAGLAVLQMTSFGDVFAQDYFCAPVSDDTDKTCAAGAGCERIVATLDVMETGKRWLEEAVSRSREQITLNVKSFSNTADLSGFFVKETKRHYYIPLVSRPVPHEQCRLCNLTSSSYFSAAGSIFAEESDIKCAACSHLVSDTAALINAINNMDNQIWTTGKRAQPPALSRSLSPSNSSSILPSLPACPLGSPSIAAITTVSSSSQITLPDVSSTGSNLSKTCLSNPIKRRCGKCVPCQASDCGLCLFCLDKKKFGGRNKFKTTCINRQCIHIPRPEYQARILEAHLKDEQEKQRQVCGNNTAMEGIVQEGGKESEGPDACESRLLLGEDSYQHMLCASDVTEEGPRCDSQPVAGQVVQNISIMTSGEDSSQQGLQEDRETEEAEKERKEEEEEEEEEEEDGMDVMDRLDEKLKNLDMSLYKDPESLLLLKLWKDDMDIQELLVERENVHQAKIKKWLEINAPLKSAGAKATNDKDVFFGEDLEQGSENGLEASDDENAGDLASSMPMPKRHRVNFGTERQSIDDSFQQRRWSMSSRKSNVSKTAGCEMAPESGVRADLKLLLSPAKTVSNQLGNGYNEQFADSLLKSTDLLSNSQSHALGLNETLFRQNQGDRFISSTIPLTHAKLKRKPIVIGF